MPRKTTSSKVFNHYIDSYDPKLVTFLHRISEGCYHRRLFQRFNIKERLYDDYLHRLRFCLPPEHLAKTVQDRRTLIHFLGDAYQGKDNYLLHTFYLKTLKTNSCFSNITVLQLLAAAPDTYHSLASLLDDMEEQIASSEYDCDIPQNSQKLQSDNQHAIRTALQFLLETGLIELQEKDKSYQYRLARNPLLGLSTAEAQQLYLAVTFYKNIFLFAAPGSWLTDTLQALYPECAPGPYPYQFKSNNPTRVLDEHLLAEILTIFEKSQLIQRPHPRKKSLRTFTPLCIETNYRYNRQYLVLQEKKDIVRWQLRRFPQKYTCIDRPAASTTADPPAAPKGHSTILRLQVSAKSAMHKKRLCSAFLDSPYPVQIMDPAAGTLNFQADITVTDSLQLTPWLRSLHPYIEILPSPSPSITKLRKHMQQDIEEALKNYAEPIQ